MGEIRTLAEGTLRWVEASGSALTWQTGASVATATDTAAWAARSGLLGFVQAGASFSLAENWATIMNRGVPNHHILTDTPPVELRFTVLAGNTADYPSGNTAIGPSSLGIQLPPRFNIEFKSRQPERGVNTGIFYQFHHVVVLSKGYAEQPEGNTREFTFRAISAVGPTASGYLS